MTDHNHENSLSKDRQTDELDRVLDAALAKYAAVEPRPGLEDRVLANLHAEQEHFPIAAWWRWRLAAAIAALVLVAVTLAWRSRTSHPQIANQPSSTTQSPTKQAIAPIRSAENTPPREVQRGRRTVARVPTAQVVGSGPKLDQFPSRQAPSPEEIALAQYVRNFPKEAQLVARAQEESELETQREMTDAGSDTRPSTSIQQER